MVARYLLLAALPCLLVIADAQTPKVVPPASAAASTAPDLSGEAIVVEHIATVMRFAKDGSSVRTLTMIIHVLSDAGVRDTGVLSLPYASQSETAAFDYVRVRKPSGTVVETSAEDAPELPAPVTQAAPMYSDLRVKQLPVKSLSTGDTLEYQLSVRTTNTDAPGQFWREASFASGIPVRDETIEIRVPRDKYVLVKSKSVQPTITDEAGERVYRWKHETASEYPKKKEKDAPPVMLTQPEFDPDIAVTTFHSWAELGAWYQGLMKGRAVPDAGIQAKADELTKGLTTDDEKIDALYNYVSTQYRYISVSLGIGRVQPHAAADVFRNQYGDCKDKHTLLQAMLAAEKIEAAPVLIGSSMRLNEALPMPNQFDHVITLVKPGPQQIWLDSTPEVAPSRMLFATLRDKQALLAPTSGEARLLKTVKTLPFPASERETITAQLDTHGVLTAHFDLTMRDDDELMMRAVYHQVPRAKWPELEQNISYNTGFSGEVSAVEAGVPEKTKDPFHLSWDYTKKDYGDWPNRQIVGMSPWLANAIPEDTKTPERAIALGPEGGEEVDAALTLPEGYTVIKPADVKRSTLFGDYTSTYVLRGRVLQMNRRLVYKVRELPVSEWAAYRAFIKAVSDDCGQMMQLVGSDVKVAGAPSKDDTEAADLIQQAEQRLQAQDIAGADELLQRAKQRNDQQRGLWAAWGNMDWRRNRMPDAIQDYRKEIDLHPEDFWAYQQLGAAYAHEGDWKGEEEVLHAWGKADPADPKPWTSLGGLLFSQERYKDSVSAYRQAITLSTTPDQLRGALGEAQLRSGDTAAGKETLHALMDHGDDPGLLNSAAYLLGDAGIDLAADETASRKAVDILEARTAAAILANATNENLADVRLLMANWDTLGWIAFKANKLAEAETFVQAAWLLQPLPGVGLHLGQIYEAEGKKAEALTAYRLAAKMLYAAKPTPVFARRKQTIEERVGALTTEGVKEKPPPERPAGQDELGALRTYTIKNPLKGAAGSADFLLRMGDNHADDVRFLRGSDALKAATPELLATIYRTPLPAGSHAKILRRSILACTAGSTTCLLVLMPPSTAKIDN